MDSRPANDFRAAADRLASERERLIAQLDQEQRQRVQIIREGHRQAVLERQREQATERDDKIKNEREKLLREAPQPRLTPDGASSHPRTFSQADRVAQERIDLAHSQEIEQMGQHCHQRVDQVLEENGLSYDQFHSERVTIAENSRAAFRQRRAEARAPRGSHRDRGGDQGGREREE